MASITLGYIDNNAIKMEKQQKIERWPACPQLIEKKYINYSKSLSCA